MSLVYYLRVLRLFWGVSQKAQVRIIPYDSLRLVSNRLCTAINMPHSIVPSSSTRVQLTATCVVLLIVIPLFLIKPFVL